MAESLLKKGLKGRLGGWKGGCKVEEGVAEINNQLCTAMITMVLSEDTTRQFTNSTVLRAELYFINKDCSQIFQNFTVGSVEPAGT